MPNAFDRAKNTLRYLRRRAHVLIGKDFHTPLDARVARERLGSSYGGWWVIPSLINAESVVYGVGVGRDVSWDLAMIERFGCMVHAFDPTPRCRKWLATQPTPTKFVFHPCGLADYDGIATFVMPSSDPEWDSYSTVARASGTSEVVKLDVCRLETLMKSLGHDHVDVLKMDIEGGEYAVLADILQGKVRPTQILVEYHYWENQKTTVPRTAESVRALKAAGYRLFARSPVGPELSFVHATAFTSSPSQAKPGTSRGLP